MSNVEEIYNAGKLLVRAMDFPQLKKGTNCLEYDCTTWANEFCMLTNDMLSSASTTLIIPNVGVSTYKNIGYLINSDLANCFHISKSDSGSSGNINSGDFLANKADFETISQLANHIKNNNDTTMNEVNINTTIESVEGLFFNECPRRDLLLQMIFVVRTCLKNITGVEYPIYSYNMSEGKLNYVELTDELEQKIIQSLKNSKVFYWPDEYDEPIVDEIKSTYNYTK